MIRVSGQRKVLEEREIQDSRRWSEAPPIAFRLGTVVETLAADGMDSVEIEKGSILKDIFVANHATLTKGEVVLIAIGGDGLACVLGGRSSGLL